MWFLEFLGQMLMFVGRIAVGGFLIYVILATALVHWYDLAPRMPKWTWKYENEIHDMWVGAHKVKLEKLTLRNFAEDASLVTLMLLVSYGMEIMPLAVLTCVVYVEGYLYFKYFSPTRKITPIYRIENADHSDYVEG